MRKKQVAVIQDPAPGECPHCGSRMAADPLDEVIPAPDVKTPVCADEGCELKVYCEGWCHMHFLAKFAVSTKKAKAPFAWG